MKSSINVVMFLNLFILIAAAAPIAQGLNSRKLDDTTVPRPTDEKCTTCNPNPPPPPPPECPPPPPPECPPPPPPECPPPPPPECPPPPAPVLPPPAPKKPPSSYCAPPPPLFIYFTGPPGDLYPIDGDYNGGGKAGVALPVLIGCGLLGLLVRFGF